MGTAACPTRYSGGTPSSPERTWRAGARSRSPARRTCATRRFCWRLLTRDSGRYRSAMASEEREAIPEKIARLLETLEPDERQEIVAWLLTARWPQHQARLQPWSGVSFQRGEAVKLRRELGGWLPAGEESQLVTVRLPAEQHERLRTWCGEHNFTMAAVVRGLIERFLDAQGRSAPPAEA